MFYYLNGTLALVDGDVAVIDCGGVGYACRTTAFTLSRLQTGQPAKLYTYCNVREDAFDIFGFSTREEKRCFELLIGVTGVGPKAALAILSSTTPERFSMAIFTQDEKALTAAPGIGKKLAQRIILELKDKLGADADADFSAAKAAVPAAQSSNAALANAALQELGYSAAEISAALKGAAPDASTQELVRYALRAMVIKG